MKKCLATLLMILLCTAGTHAQTKTSGGVRRGGTSMDISNNMKERIKAELNLTDDKTDSVAAIQQTYQYKIRALKIDTNLDKESKKNKVAELEGERKQKLKVVLTDEQIIKLEGLVEKRRTPGEQAGSKPVVE